MISSSVSTILMKFGSRAEEPEEPLSEPKEGSTSLSKLIDRPRLIEAVVKVLGDTDLKEQR
jgi:hypothetical protein